MIQLPFLCGAVVGLVMSSALWFGLAVFCEAAATGTQPDVDAPRPAVRSAIGILLVAVALLPLYLMYREESWSALRGYGAGAVGTSVLLLIELVRAARSQGA